MPNAYQDAIRKVASNIIDETVQEKLAEEQQYSLDPVMQKVAAVYASLEQDSEEEATEKIASDNSELSNEDYAAYYYEQAQAMKTAAQQVFAEAEILEKCAIETYQESQAR